MLPLLLLCALLTTALAAPEPVGQVRTRDAHALPWHANGTVWSGGERGVWRQAGKTWKRVSNVPAISIAVHLTGPGKAAWIDPAGRVWRN